MGSSLKCGARFVKEQFPSCREILITVCDQPLLTSDHLRKMLQSFQFEKKQIVASFYSGSPGVPVIFHRSMLNELLTMDDQHGAKMIIKHHLESASLIDFPQGATDLDTPDDWESLSRPH
jgi:molybdenum cofactor cytidylyltransferase